MESLEYSENLINKAKGLVEKAEKELQGYFGSYSNIILWCQEAIELCGKAIFKIMNLDFPKEHQLLFSPRKSEVRPVVRELLKKEFPKYFAYREEIPRVIFLTYFWHNLYTIAKYGLSDVDVSPDKLFSKEDAELALKHAKDCIKVANNLLSSKKWRGRKNGNIL